LELALTAEKKEREGERKHAKTVADKLHGEVADLQERLDAAERAVKSGHAEFGRELDKFGIGSLTDLGHLAEEEKFLRKQVRDLQIDVERLKACLAKEKEDRKAGISASGSRPDPRTGDPTAWTKGADKSGKIVKTKKR
jgi:chromosome segregation ATPase